MADVTGVNQGIPQGGAYIPPAAPPPQEAPPQAPSDSVVLQRGDDGTRTYTKERLANGVEVQTWQARSGVKYEVAQTPEGTRFHVDVPAGMTAEPIEIVGASSPKEGSAIVAHPAGKPQQAVPAQVTADGRIAFSLMPNGPMAMFDPNSLDFGIATPGQQQPGPGGMPVMMQALQEVVHADSSHTIKANAVIADVPGKQGMFSMQPGVPHREVPAAEMALRRDGRDVARQGKEARDGVSLQPPVFAAGRQELRLVLRIGPLRAGAADEDRGDIDPGRQPHDARRERGADADLVVHEPAAIHRQAALP